MYPNQLIFFMFYFHSLQKQECFLSCPVQHTMLLVCRKVTVSAITVQYSNVSEQVLLCHAFYFWQKILTDVWQLAFFVSPLDQ